MQSLLCFALAFLCSLSLASSEHPPQCNGTQYLQKPNQDNQKRCCDMCPPGHYLEKRCDSSPTVCKPCEAKRYMNRHNEEWGCNFCRSCNRANMEYQSPCNSSHDAVCKCKRGHECADRPCTRCQPLPPTTTPAPTPLRAALTPGSVITVETTPTKDSKDSWLLAVIVLLVILTIVFVAINQTTQLWITSKCSYLLAKTHDRVSPCSEDEEVTKPVQEAGNVTKILIDP